LATQAEIAAHLFMSIAEVSKLAASGVLPKPAKRGEYDLNACREAYIRNIREIAAGRKAAPVDPDDKDAPLDLVTERARLASEQADAQSMKNAVTRGELIPKADVVAGMQTSFVRVRARLLSLPTKVAPLIIGTTSLTEVVEKLTDLINEALAELTSTNAVPADTRGSVDGGGDH
jgi:terminase small subunit / prophage DNA-packing protein